MANGEALCHCLTVLGQAVLLAYKTKPRHLRRSREALPQTKVAVSLRRDDSRIAADLDWRLKALIDHKVDGNSAVFSAEEEGYFYRNPET